MSIFWEMYQQGQISNANSTASRAESQTTQLQDELRRMQGQIDALALTCQAMWELVSDRMGIDERDMVNQMQEIDQRDGKADGKMGGSVAQCSGCGRTLNRRRGRCMYCGKGADKDHIFQV